jgi:hypothetical protein
MIARRFGWKLQAAIGGDKGAEGGSGPHKGAALTEAVLVLHDEAGAVVLIERPWWLEAFKHLRGGFPQFMHRVTLF